MIKPINKTLLVEPLKKDQTTKSGLVLASSGNTLNSGIVRAVSDDVPGVKVGDRVAFREWSPEKIEEDEQELYLIEFADVLGIYE